MAILEERRFHFQLRTGIGKRGHIRMSQNNAAEHCQPSAEIRDALLAAADGLERAFKKYPEDHPLFLEALEALRLAEEAWIEQVRPKVLATLKWQTGDASIEQEARERLATEAAVGSTRLFIRLQDLQLDHVREKLHRAHKRQQEICELLCPDYRALTFVCEAYGIEVGEMKRRLWCMERALAKAKESLAGKQESKEWSVMWAAAAYVSSFRDEANNAVATGRMRQRAANAMVSTTKSRMLERAVNAMVSAATGEGMSRAAFCRAVALGRRIPTPNECERSDVHTFDFLGIEDRLPSPPLIGSPPRPKVVTSMYDAGEVARTPRVKGKDRIPPKRPGDITYDPDEVAQTPRMKAKVRKPAK